MKASDPTSPRPDSLDADSARSSTPHLRARLMNAVAGATEPRPDPQIPVCGIPRDGSDEIRDSMLGQGPVMTENKDTQALTWGSPRKGTEFISPARECGGRRVSVAESLKGRYLSCRTHTRPILCIASSAPRAAVT